eukprot:1174281-Prorocentrum_minimum.AAC.1
MPPSEHPGRDEATAGHQPPGRTRGTRVPHLPPDTSHPPQSDVGTGYHPPRLRGGGTPLHAPGHD